MLSAPIPRPTPGVSLTEARATPTFTARTTTTTTTSLPVVVPVLLLVVTAMRARTETWTLAKRVSSPLSILAGAAPVETAASSWALMASVLVLVLAAATSRHTVLPLAAEAVVAVVAALLWAGRAAAIPVAQALATALHHSPVIVSAGPRTSLKILGSVTATTAVAWLGLLAVAV